MLDRLARVYALRLRNWGLHPAMIVYASYGAYLKRGRTGPPPDPMVRKLLRKLLSIGPLSTRVSGNLVGHCAEVWASNKLLKINAGFDLRRIHFSEAVRPRTMQKFPMCPNCNRTFS